MALAATGLNAITGLFPGAGWNASATSAEDQGLNDAGYVCIPLESIRYTGSVPNTWAVDKDGGLEDGGGDGDAVDALDGISSVTSTSVTGSFRKFIRGIHETAYHYTTGLLTGNNAYTYWKESQGSFTVYNATTLTRRYSTDLYYEIGEGIASKTLT